MFWPCRLIEINITPTASESNNKVIELPLDEEDSIDDSNNSNLVTTIK